MTEQEFEYVFSIHHGDEEAGFSSDVKLSAQMNGWVKDGKVTEKGYKALAPYKVDNAIIMAAGRSRRCMPLSNYLPKGLFEIKGDTMIERQIKQLKAAGINEIILVVGYLKEKYHELIKTKYPDVIIIDNDEWNEKNNLFSLWYARKYLKASYVCCSDNWFAHNVFRDYVYDSYYACKYSDQFCDEYCVTDFDKNGYMTSIKKGGEKKWYTIGEAFFSSEFSKKFLDFLQGELYDPDLKYMLWDDFQIRHINDLKMKIKRYDEEECKEFDTTEDILQFYPQFKDFIEQFFQEEEIANSSQRISYLSNYADTKTYAVVSTEQLTGRLHVNENLFEPSPKCLSAIQETSVDSIKYYDLTREDELTVAVSKKIDIPTDNILIHSGSSDIIKTIMTLVLNKDDTVLISAPAWNYYKSVVELRFAKAVYYDILPGEDEYYFDVKGLLEQAKKTTPKIIVITTPHNPTGAVISPSDLESIVKENPKSLIILDEAYLGFSDVQYDVKHLLQNYSNIVFSRTFSKFYGLAGLRVGYAICTPMAKQVFRLDINPFRVCNISRKACIAALEDTSHYEKQKKEIISVRDNFCKEINSITGMKAFKSYANFIYIRFNGIDVQRLKEYLQDNGILVRLWTETSRLSMRVTVAPKETMDKLLVLIKKFCSTLNQDC